MSDAIDDPVLGHLIAHEVLTRAYTGSLMFGGRQVDLRIDPDGGDMEICLGVARETIGALSAIDRKARTVAAASLLTTYNENWRCFDEKDESGVFKEHERPVLAEEEFMSTIVLESVGVTGKMVEFWYSDADLFWGHSINVVSFDGVVFSDTDVSLFG